MVLGRKKAAIQHSIVLERNGQAAITDAMFLLVIVSGLSALMFFFITGSPVRSSSEAGYFYGRSSGYGVSVERIALDFYGTDYATSALQTVLYSSTPRNPDETLEDAREIDYLLAFLKEDFANDRKLSDSSKSLLVKDINTVMASTLPTHDFIFFMRTLPREYTKLSEFVFVLLKYTEFDSATGEAKIAYYLCSPGEGRDRIIEEELLSQAGAVIKAQPVILRFRTTLSEKTDRIFTALNMWSSVELPKEIIISEDDLNCSVVS